MPKNQFALFSIIALLLLISPKLWAQDDLVTALNKHLIEIKTLDPDSNYSDLDSLKPYLKDKQVFALGEATHGTHEFSLYKQRMLEFLVKEMSVKAFVIEDNFATTQIMNDYILGRKGPVTDSLNGIGFGVWRSREMLALCTWLQHYNAAQSPENKVQFFGCDMQWASSALMRLKDQLQPVGKFTPEMETALTESRKPLNVITDSGKTIMQAAVDQLSKIEFTTGDTALYRHYVRVVQQYVQFINTEEKRGAQFAWRDKCMAENCEWIYNYTGHQKMMIWAHNAHIGKDGGSMRVATMGSYLASYFGDKYYAMGFDFYEGWMRTVDPTGKKMVPIELPAAKKGSSGLVFSQCRLSNFIIDIKSTSAAEPVADKFFNKDILSISQGPVYNPKAGEFYVNHKLAQTYDAVIFFKETTAVQNVK